MVGPPPVECLIAVFWQVKTDYENHAIKEHPGSLPEDLQVEPTLSSGDVDTLKDITMIRVRGSFWSLEEKCLQKHTLKCSLSSALFWSPPPVC
jgi:hypothetical protein